MTEPVCAFPSVRNPVMRSKAARIPVRQKMVDLGSDCVEFMIFLVFEGDRSPLLGYTVRPCLYRLKIEKLEVIPGVGYCGL